MKRVVFMAFLILLATSFSATAVEFVGDDGSSSDVPSFVGYAPNRIVVNFDPSTLRGLDRAAMARGRTGIPALDHLGSRHGVISLRPQFPGAKKKEFKGKVIDLAGWHKVKFSRGADVLAVVEEYKAIPGVVDAQPVGIHRVSQPPNDPWYSPAHDPNYQWQLPKIQVPETFDIQTEKTAIIVAVLDTGVRYFHKDLGGSDASLANPTAVSGNMWINLAEKNGTPGVDDDGPIFNPLDKQYVDDWIGWDFVDDPCGQPGPFLCYPCCCFDGEDCLDPDNDPRDFHGHGTHCAGNISAINNNEFATASPAGGWGSWWTPPFGNGVKVMALRVGWNAVYVLFEAGLVGMDYAAEALYYAANNGAKIASCSWGSDDSGGIGAAIDYFVGNGGLIFKAAGNDGTETADYLCARDDVLCVAATDQNDCKASFSTYGTWVDVSAPGVQVGSLWHSYSDPVNDYVNKLDGTSMATPLAASVAALIWSRDPGLSADQVQQYMFASADPIDGLLCNSSFAGKLGAGRINAFQALLSVDPSPACTDADSDGYYAEGGDCGPVDCDDTDPAINPGASEICGDTEDNDCDGLIDSNDPDCSTPPVCTDVDGDGYYEEGGDCGPVDCNDADPTVHPGATEICGDGIDQDCSGSDLTCTDPNDVDDDGDGYTENQGDCDDSNPAINPGASEICGDTEDNDCDGLIDSNDPDCSTPPVCTDVDGDGYYAEGGDCGPVDCDDADPQVFPGAFDYCRNGIDEDCDGFDRLKGKGCNDGGGNGGVKEICDNGIDDDGDGKTDCADKKDCGKDPACP